MERDRAFSIRPEIGRDIVMLKDKIAVITGGARGIGGYVARKIAEYGAKVVVVDLSGEGARKNAEAIEKEGGVAVWVKADVSKREDCDAAVRKALDVFGRVDILVNCAGINIACKVADLTDALWDKINNINLKGTLYMNQACIREMRKQRYGRLVNIASISGKTPEDMNGAYCVSKAGVMMLTQVIALEHAGDGITANAICPGPVNTVIMDEVFVQRGAIAGVTPDEYRERFLGDIPLGRMAEPEDIAELACFMASDKASYITGQCYTISGGKIWS